MACTLNYAGFNDTYGAGYRRAIPDCFAQVTDADSLQISAKATFDPADVNKLYYCTIYVNLAGNQPSHSTQAVTIPSSPWIFSFPLTTFSPSPTVGLYSVTKVEIRTSSDMNTAPICSGSPPAGDILCNPLNLISGNVTYSCGTTSETSGCNLNYVACTGTAADNCYTASTCDNQCKTIAPKVCKINSQCPGGLCLFGSCQDKMTIIAIVGGIVVLMLLTKRK